MLELYYHPISANSRRVWIALLEKNLPFELKLLNLNGDQHQVSFLSLNPFHHVPVLVDHGFRIVESIAILDYLEAKYSTPAMLPNNAKDLAIVRMVQIVTITELVPAVIRLTSQVMGFVEKSFEKQEQTSQTINTALAFFEDQFDHRGYFGSDSLTLADIVAGTVVPGLPDLGIGLDNYPKLKVWAEQLASRPSWQATQPNQDSIQAFIPQMRDLVTAALS